MSLTEGALKNNRITATLLVLLLFAGSSAYLGMPQQMDPGFTVRTVQIVTRFPGASPERVEKLVSDPIEQAVQSVPELDFVASTSRTGVSVVAVAIREEFMRVRPIFDAIRRKVEAVKLPAGVGVPEINDELGDIYPMIFTISADGFSDRQVKEIAKNIRDQLLLVPGVGKVETLGEQEERVFVEYSDARLARLGLTPATLQQSLQARNIILPGGEIEIGPEALALEPSGNFDSIEDIRQTILRAPSGRLTYLEDVADVQRAYVDPPRGIVTSNGFRGIALAINMSDGYNLVELGGRIQTFFEGLLRYYPHGIDFHVAYYQPKDVEKKVDEFISNVVQAVVIVLVVMLVSLGLRTGLIVSALIPSAMIITIFVIGLTGETINQMSLAALIIALGLLVDNAIVVSESILVSMGRGVPVFQAAVDSCRELQVPLLISSLTTASAFLPIYLAESTVGEYTQALFVVVSITLLVSWLLALTMTPLLCQLFMRAPKDGGESFDSPFYRAYKGTLRFVLRQRLLSVLIVIGLFAGSLPLWGLVPNIFFPAQASPFFMAEFSLPPGTSMDATLDMSRRIDRFVQDEMAAGGERAEGVVSWTTFIGETPPPFTLGFSPSPSQGGYCELMVNMTSVPATADAMAKLRQFALAELPDVKTHIRMLSAGPPVDKPVQVRISGQRMDEIYAVVERVKDRLRAMDGVRNIGDDWGARTKKLIVDIDSERALRSGVSHQEVAQSIQTFVSGTTATYYREGDESIPVVLRSVGEERRSFDRMRTLSVYSQRQNPRPLSQVAALDVSVEAASVLRRDRARTVTVEAEVAEGTTAAEVFAALRPWLQEEQKTWPLGLRWAYGGEFESSQKANASIGEKLPIAGMVILLLLVWQFNSMRKTAIVLSSIVLALIGVVLGLVAFESTFGFMTLLGVISLAGIVINNAIVLIDRIRIEIEDNGLPPKEAVVFACVQRVRPILLTTATTIASLVPLYLTGGAMWQPMAVAIMSGLLFSTMLTLLFVPLLYSIFFRVERPA